MSKALGMVEYTTVATGIQAADLMVKTAEVDVVEAQTVCPGKYMVIISGDLSSVRASVDAAKTRYPDQMLRRWALLRRSRLQLQWSQLIRQQKRQTYNWLSFV